MTRHFKEIIIKNLFACFAFLSVLLLGLIVLFLFREGLPLFQQVSVSEFIFGSCLVSHL